MRKCSEGQKSGSGLDKNRKPETDMQMERKRIGGGGGGSRMDGGCKRLLERVRKFYEGQKR